MAVRGSRGYVVFIVYFTYSYRDFAVMKDITPVLSIVNPSRIMVVWQNRCYLDVAELLVRA